MFSRKAYLLWIVLAFLFCGAVLGYAAWLNMLSFRQNNTDSLVRSYALAGKGIAGKIEFAMKYGKPLDNFYGIRDLLAEVKQYLPAVADVAAVMPNGRVVADLNGPSTGRRMNPDLLRKLHAEPGRFLKNYITATQGNKQHVVIPVSNQGKWAGSIDIVFDRQVIDATVNRFGKHALVNLFILALGATLLMSLYFGFLLRRRPGELNLKLWQVSLITVLAAAQIIYGYLNYTLFKTGYLDITRENTLITSKIIRNDIEAVLAKGVTYGDLYQLENYFNQIVAALPEIAAIRLTDSQNRILSASTGVSGSDWRRASDDYIYAHRLKADSQGRSGELTVLLSRENINRKIRAILLDAATVLTMSVFLMLEMTLLVTLILRLQLNRERGTPRESGRRGAFWDGGGIRPLAFIIYQAMFLTATIVPVMMKTFQHPLAGLPKELAFGLPVAVEMFAGLVAMVAAGYWSDRRGWRTTFAFGLGCFVLGAVFSGVAAGPPAYILARGLVGAGTGLMIIAMRTCVISQSAATARNAGIAALNAGAVSGINCGVVGGAMLADRIGFAGVFFIASGLSLVTLLFLLPKPSERLERVDERHERRASLGRFILNPQVVLFFVLMLIPLGICTMFLDYYFPLFASRLGVSSSDTGRAFLLNGLCLVLLGPALSKFAAAKLGAGRAMILGALLTVGAIVIFTVYGSLAAALTAIVILGVAESFGTAAQVDYFMNLEAVQEYGWGKSLSYYGLAGKLGNMLGPLAFGGVAVLGLTAGVGLIGGAALLCLLLFITLSRNSRHKEPTGNEQD